MSTAIEAPRQHKQPSRKGKRAWRKHVDVTDVQQGLEQVREEEIQGGVVAEKPSDELFTIDAVGSETVRRAQLKNSKPLKSDEILAQRSVIPAVDSRKRPSSKVTDGVIERKTKRHRSDWVTHEEWLRLKKAAKEPPTELQGTQGTVSYDPWSDNTTPSNFDESKFSFLPKPKPLVAPPTLKQAPLSLASNGKSIPSVRNPDGGTSYNPAFEDWDNLLTKEGEKEVEAEKRRMEEEKAEKERLARIAEANNDDDHGMAGSDDESAWEGFESEYETSEIMKKRPERKTKAQRNKIKRRKEAEARAKWEAKMKKREQQAAQVKAIAEAVEKREAQRKAQEKDDGSSDEGDEESLRKRRFGKLHVPEKSLELVLPDELQDSLRLLKPEGNLLGDRFRNLLVQGKLEVRNPVIQSKKPKKKSTEKWTHKDFKI